MEEQLKNLSLAARVLRSSPTAQRNQVLTVLAELLPRECARIIEANKADLATLAKDVNAAFRDRLTLTFERIAQMEDSLRKVAALPDPLNEIVEKSTLENGLLLKKVRSPLGVILMIFEARPNVVTEAFSLALKSGNALIMRGGSESRQTAAVLYELIARAMEQAKLPTECFWGITDSDRTLTQTLMKQNKYIDVLVPRGGDGLIDYVLKNATIPIIKNDRGLCHVYIHEDADAEMAIEIVDNAKTQRPGVCNSMETLLVHEKQKHLLPKIYERLSAANVEWFVSPEVRAVLGALPRVHAATEKNFDTEYLDMKINARIVSSLDEALDHIARHGSRHSESIVTASETAARKFQNMVDAAAVYWNASTRFTDGYQFGLGGELGISTQKLHVRGPVGLRELTSLRWIIDGQGQVRR